jgi:hypothetical protein
MASSGLNPLSSVLSVSSMNSGVNIVWAKHPKGSPLEARA